MSTELTTITHKHHPPDQPHHDSPHQHNSQRLAQQSIFPIFHPNFKQRALQSDEKINHIKDFKALILSFLLSLELTIWGLFVRTPKDFYHEFRYLITHPKALFIEILCAITISIVVVPEAISFAHLVQAPATVGLHAAFLMMFIIGVLGARPASISSAGASTYLILAPLSENSGPLGHLALSQRMQLIYFTVILSGILEVLLSWLKLASYFIKLLPTPVMIGFVNGLAVVILQSQFDVFKHCTIGADGIEYSFKECPHDQLKWIGWGEAELWLIFILLATALAIMFLWEKIPIIGRLVPGSLIAMVLCSIIEHFIFRSFNRETRTLGDTSPVQGYFPRFNNPDIFIDGVPWGTIVIYACYVGLVGAIESLLTVAAMNQTLREKTTDGALNKEAFAQGIANIVCGLCGSLGGCETYGESNLNLINGSRHRLSSVLGGWVIIAIVLWVYPAVNFIPIAAFAAIICSVAFHTFYWPTFIIIWRIRKSDALIILAVTLLAIFTNLGIATLVGIGIGALTLVLDSLNAMRVESLEIDVIIPLSATPPTSPTHPSPTPSNPPTPSATASNNQPSDIQEPQNTQTTSQHRQILRGNIPSNTIAQDPTHSIENGQNAPQNDNAQPSSIALTLSLHQIDETPSPLPTPVPSSLTEDTPLTMDRTQSNQLRSSQIDSDSARNSTNLSPIHELPLNSASTAQTPPTSGSNNGQNRRDQEQGPPGSIYSLPLEVDQYICYKYYPPRVDDDFMYEPSINRHYHHDASQNDEKSPNATNNDDDIHHNNITNHRIDKYDSLRTRTIAQEVNSKLRENGDELSDTSDDEEGRNDDNHDKNTDGKHSGKSDPIADNNDNNHPNSTSQSPTANSPTTHNSTLTISSHSNQPDPNDIVDQNVAIVTPKIYRLHGILFFGSTTVLAREITPSIDPEFVIFDCSDVIFNDLTATTALLNVIKEYSDLEKRVKLCYITNTQSRRCIQRHGPLTRLLSRIHRTTYIVYTKREYEARQSLKKEIRKTEKAAKKTITTANPSIRISSPQPPTHHTSSYH